jgi:RecA-family ATPase
MSKWDADAPPPREWAVHDRIPLRQPTLFSGEGAVGKTLAELHLSAAHVLGRDWLGTMPEPGPSIYYGAEDEAGELYRRLA